MAYYIDCDYIIYEYNQAYIDKYHPNYTRACHPNLNDYKSTCNAGLWRDGSFGNALIALNNRKETDALHVIKDGIEILTITRETPRAEYVRGEAA